MNLYFTADFCTDGDYSFNSPDELFNPKAPLYKGADIDYICDVDNDSEFKHISLKATGEDNACRWALRDLLENMMCSISTCKYYLVKDLYNLLYYFYDGLWDDKNQDKVNCLSGNYAGTQVSLHMRKNEERNS